MMDWDVFLEFPQHTAVRSDVVALIYATASTKWLQDQQYG